jgi:2-(1,2-epoxy-1,2-dihydrophenyl)acetyl-CoA isomerase
MKDYPEPPQGLAVQHDDAVLRVRLDRPDRRNALTDEMVLTLIETIEAAGSDESVRVIAL